MRSIMSRFVLAVAFIALAPTIGAQVPYTFTNLDVPGAARTFAQGINDSGQIVGHYYQQASDLTAHAFLFDGATYQTIDYPGAVETVLNGISGDGTMVGTYLTSFAPNGYGATHSFVYTNGTFTTLPDAPGSYPAS